MLAAAWVGLLAAGGCSSGGADRGAQAEVPSPSGEAPDFTLPTVDGEQVSLAGTDGQVRLIDFWATWCAPCREEVPMLNELQASFGERGFRILAISDEDAEAIREFVAHHGVVYTNLVGTEEVFEAYGVPGLPAAFLLDAEGRVVESFMGPKPRKVLVQKIEALLRETPST
jgi:peroxiredoxin